MFPISDIVREVALWFISGIASFLSGLCVFLYGADGMLLAAKEISEGYRENFRRARLRSLAIATMLAFIAIFALPWSGYSPLLSAVAIIAAAFFWYFVAWKTGIYREVVRRNIEKQKAKQK